MKKLIKFLRRIRVKFRRSTPLTKAVVIGALVLSLVTLLTLNLTIDAIRNRAEELRKEAAALEHENSQLEENIDGLGSSESVENIAQGELGMVPTDAVVLQPGQ